MTEVDPSLISLLKGEARHHWASCEVAWASLEAAMQTPNNALIWSCVDLLLMSLTRFSRVFWPIEPRKPNSRRLARGAAMRALADAPDDPPRDLLSVRHASEHFDERLEAWFDDNSASGNIIIRTIGPISMLGGMGNVDMAQHLDPTDWTLTVFKESVDLCGAFMEAGRLAEGVLDDDPMIRPSAP